jgi:hypothetical protein
VSLFNEPLDCFNLGKLDNDDESEVISENWKKLESRWNRVN